MPIDDKLQISYKEIVKEVTESSGTIDIEQLIQILEKEWIATYYDMSSHKPNIMQFPEHGFIYLYDHASANSNNVEDRIVVAYGRSIENDHNRDKNRIKGFLGSGLDIPGKGKFDKGHVLAHGMGGGLDQNLFPQRPELNRGISPAGKIYRKIEKYASDHLGTFVFSRKIYNDDSWVPSSLEYGVLNSDNELWVEWFEN